jgi:GntR family transcriptional regulator
VTVPVDPNDPRPPYLQIAAEMQEAIKRGDLRPGQRLASGRALAKQYGVAPMTIQHALQELRSQGLVIAWQGRGVFVNEGTGGTASGDDDPLQTVISRLEQVQDGLRRLEDRVLDLEKRATPSRGRAPRRDG